MRNISYLSLCKMQLTWEDVSLTLPTAGAVMYWPKAKIDVSKLRQKRPGLSNHPLHQLLPRTTALIDAYLLQLGHSLTPRLSKTTNVALGIQLARRFGREVTD